MWRNVLATADSDPGQFKCRPIFLSETEPGTSQVLRTLPKTSIFEWGQPYETKFHRDVLVRHVSAQHQSVRSQLPTHTAINNAAISHSLQRSDVTWHPLYVTMDDVTTCVFVHFLWPFFPLCYCDSNMADPPQLSYWFLNGIQEKEEGSSCLVRSKLYVQHPVSVTVMMSALTDNPDSRRYDSGSVPAVLCKYRVSHSLPNPAFL